jgi:hypothetical protein
MCENNNKVQGTKAIARCKNVRVACVKVVARHENIARHENNSKV